MDYLAGGFPTLRLNIKNLIWEVYKQSSFIRIFFKKKVGNSNAFAIRQTSEHPISDLTWNIKSNIACSADRLFFRSYGSSLGRGAAKKGAALLTPFFDCPLWIAHFSFPILSTPLVKYYWSSRGASVMSDEGPPSDCTSFWRSDDFWGELQLFYDCRPSASLGMTMHGIVLGNKGAALQWNQLLCAAPLLLKI